MTLTILGVVWAGACWFVLRWLRLSVRGFDLTEQDVRRLTRRGVSLDVRHALEKVRR